MWYKNTLEEEDNIVIFYVFGVGVINIALLGPLTLVMTPVLILFTLSMMIMTLF